MLPTRTPKGEINMKLPIGISTFSEIRENGYIYADKTEFALRLIEQHKYVFLSRPRRFGKSLFLDTLKEIFEGNSELFNGLYIHDRYDFEPYPVIKISFGGNRSVEEMLNMLMYSLQRNSEALGVECKSRDYAVCFSELISNVCRKYDHKVVVLIDEYDKPILDNIDQPEVAMECREILKRFYTQLKENDACLRFVFLTGVSKFARVSIFSGLNNLDDIILDKPYAAICGYTQENIETLFAPMLDGVDMEKFRAWYNGYNFNGENVYNPFDVLLFIAKGHLYDSYWFSTGTPGFLIKLLKNQEFFAPELENLRAGKNLVDSYDVENIRIEPILFQSGYLTLDAIEETPFGSLEYRLRIPNREVQISFNDMLMELFTGPSYSMQKKSELYLNLASGDMESVRDNLHALYAGIPYHHFTNNNICKYEGYYASVFYACIASLGLRIIPEDVTNRGRIDFTVFIENRIYIFEFKLTDEEPLKQIREKRYFEKYLDKGMDIIIAGIVFDEKERNIKKLEWESVAKAG
jgi:hypothetical protein